MDIDRKYQIASCKIHLENEVTMIKNVTLSEMCLDVLRSSKFLICPGSSSPKRHHAYEGGLVVHTSEVMENAILMSNAKQYVVDRDAIRAAVIWHDYGKIFDYTLEKDKNGDYKTYDHYETIKHLSRSYAEFMIEARIRKMGKELENKIGHILLSHHGRKEWGSPVEPISPEAFIVHAADHISAQCAKDYYVR